MIVRLIGEEEKTDFKGKLEQMAVQFYQLFANTIRWSLEDLKNWWISKKTKEFEEILPTFCHGTKVKPWKFEKKLQKLSFVWREGGRKEEKRA